MKLLYDREVARAAQPSRWVLSEGSTLGVVEVKPLNPIQEGATRALCFLVERVEGWWDVRSFKVADLYPSLEELVAAKAALLTQAEEESLRSVQESARDALDEARAALTRAKARAYAARRAYDATCVALRPYRALERARRLLEEQKRAKPFECYPVPEEEQ